MPLILRWTKSGRYVSAVPACTASPANSKSPADVGRMTSWPKLGKDGSFRWTKQNFSFVLMSGSSFQRGLTKAVSDVGSGAFFQELEHEFQCSERGIYIPQVVIWLMLQQQLFGQGTLTEAVEQVVLGQPRSLLPSHKRIREGTVSSRTGAYSQARKRLPIAVCEKVAQQVFEETLKSPGIDGRAAGVYFDRWLGPGAAAHTKVGT